MYEFVKIQIYFTFFFAVTNFDALHQLALIGLDLSGLMVSPLNKWFLINVV